MMDECDGECEVPQRQQHAAPHSGHHDHHDGDHHHHHDRVETSPWVKTAANLRHDVESRFPNVFDVRSTQLLPSSSFFFLHDDDWFPSLPA